MSVPADFVMAATFTLACGLVLQAALLTVYLALRDRAVLAAIAAQWRRSLFAGFMGAIASQFWFLAFAIATAASVRTLALVEVLFAQAISAFIFKQATSAREGIGMAMIVIGVIAADLVAPDLILRRYFFPLSRLRERVPSKARAGEGFFLRTQALSRLTASLFATLSRKRERGRGDRGAVC